MNKEETLISTTKNSFWSKIMHNQYMESKKEIDQDPTMREHIWEEIQANVVKQEMSSNYK